MSSALRALLVVVAAVGLALGAALIVDRLGVRPQLLSPLAACGVVAGLFWRRPAEGLLAFGLYSLLADTFEHWLQLDILLFDELGLLVLTGVAFAGGKLALERIRIGWLEGSIVALAIAAVLSSLVNGVPLETWAAALFLLLKGIAFFQLARLLRLSPADVERMGIVMLTVAGVIGLLGLIEWFDPAAFQTALGLPIFEQSRAEVTVVKSIFLHPAQYGWITAFGGLLCFARFISHRSWWAVPLGVAFAGGSLLSGRRTPLLGMLAAVSFGLAWWGTRVGSRRAAIRIWLPAAGAVVVAAALLWPTARGLALVTEREYGPSLELAGEIFAADPRSDVLAPIHPRVALYAGSVAIAKDHFPLGGGLGRFGSHLSRENYSPLYERYGLDQVRLLGPADPQAATDAYWPMVLGETGVIGALAALLFFAGMALVLWRTASAAESARLRMIALAAMFVVIEGLVRSATSSVYVAPPIAYFVLGSGGVALAAAAYREPRAPVR